MKLQPEDYPLVFWTDWRDLPPFHVLYDAQRDWFIRQPTREAPVRAVDVVTLRWIAGIKPFYRPGAIEAQLEEAARRYFVEDAFLASLVPAEEDA